MKNPGISFIVHGLEPGGFELRLLEFARHFPDRVGISIIATSRNLSLLEEFRNTRADIEVFPVKRAYLEIPKMLDIAGYISKNNISIINSFEIKGLMISLFIKRFSRGVKVVYNCINSMRDFSQRQAYALRMLLPFCDMCISNSKSSQEELEQFRYPSSKTVIIHNGVDENIYFKDEGLRSIIRRRHGLNGNFVLGTVANFRKQKNYPFLLEAFAGLARKNDNLRLVCVGGGPEFESAVRISESLGLSGKTIFTGYSSEAAAYLNAFDCFVLCSSWEGFPNVILQAMSTEVPVVAASVGGCTEIVSDFQTGILFESGNMGDFCGRTEQLIADPFLRERISSSGKNLVHEQFSLPRMLDRYVDLYSSMMPAPQPD